VDDVPQAMTSAAVKGRRALQSFTYPGQHNSEVLLEVLSYSEQKIATLIEDGVLIRQAAEEGP
jgi:hypothetical protein